MLSCILAASSEDSASFFFPVEAGSSPFGAAADSGASQFFAKAMGVMPRTPIDERAADAAAAAATPAAGGGDGERTRCRNRRCFPSCPGLTRLVMPPPEPLGLSAGDRVRKVTLDEDETFASAAARKGGVVTLLSWKSARPPDAGLD